LGAPDLAGLAALKGAVAQNTTGTDPVTSDTPLDASAVEGLVGLTAGTTNLFGDNGIIQLGAVGQYAVANGDGSSSAFSGAVSQAPSLIGVSTVTPSTVGAPSADSSAEIKVGTASLLGGTDLVDLDTTIGALAASAQDTADGTASGQYVVSDLNIGVGGTLVQATTGVLRPALATLLTAASLTGLNLTNPINADGTVTLSLTDLLQAAGVSNINDLPADTDLLQYVPQAVVTQLTNSINDILTQVQTQVTSLGLGGVVLGTALAVAKAIIDPVLTGLSSALGGPLGTAITGLAQLNVNVQSAPPGPLAADSVFTQTALQVGLGPDGSIAQVNLANASVGPNAGVAAVPVFNQDSLTISGLVGLGVLGAVFLVIRSRRRAAIVAVRG
jgi:hypothetical protein